MDNYIITLRNTIRLINVFNCIGLNIYYQISMAVGTISFPQQHTTYYNKTQQNTTTEHRRTDISLQEGSHVVAQVRGHQRRRSLTGTQSKEWKERIAQNIKYMNEYTTIV